jgi:hypothetical protein
MSSDATAASPGVAVIDAFPEASVHLARGSAVLAAALVAGSASATAPALPAGGAITGVCVAQVLSSSAEAAFRKGLADLGDMCEHIKAIFSEALESPDKRAGAEESTAAASGGGAAAMGGGGGSGAADAAEVLMR